MNLVIAITGASGAIYGIRLLEVLNKKGDIKTHLILSKWALRTIQLETDYDIEYVRDLADNEYDVKDLSASVSSGSFKTDGMIVSPCSMKTLSAISNGYDYNLIVRAASVTLKEERKLILLPRETPLTAIHLENLLKLARLGVVIMPPVPAFYSKPVSINDIIDHTVGRLLDRFNIDHNLLDRWKGETPLRSHVFSD